MEEYGLTGCPPPDLWMKQELKLALQDQVRADQKSNDLLIGVLDRAEIFSGGNAGDTAFDKLKTTIDAGSPVITYLKPLGVRHAVVVVGVTNTDIIVHDPDMDNGRFMPILVSTFLHQWREAFFYAIVVHKI